jgi:regulatory protein
MKKSNRTTVKIPNPVRLANVALHYLGRYAASESSLRRVLENRLRKAALFDEAFGSDHKLQASLRIAIETIIEKHKKSGVLNDAAFAEMKVSSLRRSGRSSRLIQQKLGMKGIAKDTIARALEHNDSEEGEGNSDMKAAAIWAKRRRLGPYRVGATDPARHKKDVASMARAGFSFDVVRKILDDKDLEEE